MARTTEAVPTPQEKAQWQQFIKDYQKRNVDAEDHPVRKAKYKAELMKIYKSFNYWKTNYGKSNGNGERA